ncbi:MAG: GTPase domain-containing protein [Hyphomicrobiaceae bacterium]|nr:GTPase domain-containing protein [Hyphomicrobiaceae bacterium]
MDTPDEEKAPRDEEIASRARAFAPVVWLIGKVQSGKSSIVRALTQSTQAEIGRGFEACTRFSRVFDFPAEAPIIRFLDTRGVGEAGYDPAADIAFCEERAHLVIAVAKAADMEQRPLLSVLSAIRERHPDWPIVVAQTSLHELYAENEGHALPYPFGRHTLGATPLHRALAHQRTLFAGVDADLPFVPIDFTLATDGLEPADYGREALIAALIAHAPKAVAAVLEGLPAAAPGTTQKSADPHVLGYALAAGASDAVPVAGAAVVPMVQAAMLRKLAQLFDREWDRQAIAEFAGAIGAGTLLRVATGFGVRQLVKLVPVYGQSVGAAAAAAASFATTFAMGKAAAYYLSRRQGSARAEEIARVYREALSEAFALSKTKPLDTGLGKPP